MGYSWGNTFVFPWQKSKELATDTVEYLHDCGSIVDVGFGGAHILKKLKREYPRKKLLGIDIVSDRFKYLPNGVQGLYGSIESLPLASHSIDGIVSTFVLEYVDKQKAIGEIRRVLKSGGKAVLYFHHPESDTLKVIRKKSQENPENEMLRYFTNALDKGMFKNNEECIEFVKRAMLVDDLDEYKVKTKNNTIQSICYVAYLRNESPINNIREVVVL